MRRTWNRWCSLRRLQWTATSRRIPRRASFFLQRAQAYLGSEAGLGRAARTRPQWAKLLETPTLPSWRSGEGGEWPSWGRGHPATCRAYASLADLRSRRLAEMDKFLANRDRDLDPELLNRASGAGRLQTVMRLKDKTQHARMVHAHARRRAARRANIANRTDEAVRGEPAARGGDTEAERRALVRGRRQGARGVDAETIRGDAPREQSAPRWPLPLQAEASLKRYKAPPPIGPTEKSRSSSTRCMTWSVDQPYSYHGTWSKQQLGGLKLTGPEAAVRGFDQPRAQSSGTHPPASRRPEALPTRRTQPLDDGKHAAPLGTRREGGLGGMTWQRRWRTRKVQVGPRPPLATGPTPAHGATPGGQRRTRRGRGVGW